MNEHQRTRMKFVFIKKDVLGSRFVMLLRKRGALLSRVTHKFTDCTGPGGVFLVHVTEPLRRSPIVGLAGPGSVVLRFSFMVGNQFFQKIRVEHLQKKWVVGCEVASLLPVLCGNVHRTKIGLQRAKG